MLLIVVKRVQQSWRSKTDCKWYELGEVSSLLARGPASKNNNAGLALVAVLWKGNKVSQSLSWFAFRFDFTP